MHSLISHRGAGVPVSVKGEDRPILIVDESRLDFVLYSVRLAGELGAVVRNFHWLAGFIFAFEGDLADLRLPFPGVGKFEYSGDFSVPRVADRLNFTPRIKTVGLGDLFGHGR